MTNDFAVADQQTRKSPLWPTVGAIGGGAVGYGLLPKWVGKPLTHEDLIKDIEDTATFSEKIKDGATDADLWKDAQSKLEAVRQAEKELVEASKPILKDCAEYNEFQSAQKNLDEAMARLEKDEAARLRSTSGTSTRVIRGKGAEQFVSPSEIALEKDALTKYEELYNAYRDAYNAAKPTVMNKAENFQAKTMDALIKINDASLKTGQKGEKVSKNIEEILKQYRDGYLGKDVFPAVTDADVLAEFNRRTGSTATDITKLPKKVKKQYEKELNEARTQKINNAMKEIFGEKQMIEFKQGIATSKATRPTYEVAEEYRHILNDNTKALNELDQALAKKGLNIGSLPSVTALEEEIKTVKADTSLVERVKKTRLEELQTKLEAAKKLEKINSKNASRLEGFWSKFRLRTDFAEQFEKEINGAATVKEKLKAFKKFIGEKQIKDKAYRATETVTTGVEALSEEEITRQAREYAQKNVKQELKDILEAKEKAYRAKAGTEGKVDAALKEAAEKKVESARTTFKEAGQKLIDKLPKKSAIKPIAGLLIGAGALGLASWLIAPKKPKEA